MRVRTFFALVGVVAIPVTVMIVSGWNPLPWVLDRVDSARSLATPPTAWRVEIAATPDWAVDAGSAALVVGGGGYVTVYDPRSGDLRWKGEVDSAAVAGPAGDVVVTSGGDAGRHKVRARDTPSGAVLWNQADVLGYWTWADLVLTLSCPDSDACQLTARSPRGQQPRWQVQLPPGARGLSGANHLLANLRSLLTARDGPAPAVLGIPIDDKVRLLDSRTGRLLQTSTSTPSSRVLAAGSGVLRIDAVYRNDGCRYTLRWTDLLHSGGWQNDSVQPRTSDGAACEQRDDPVADGGLLYVVGPERTDALLDLASGKVLYTAGDKEHIVAVGALSQQRATVVLVRTAKKDAVVARSLPGGKELWRQKTDKATEVGTDGAVAGFIQPDTGALTVRRLDTGAVLIQATSLAKLIGYTADGLVLNETLRVGLLRYGSVHP